MKRIVSCIFLLQILIARYGECSKYIWESDICTGSLKIGVDLVYTKLELGIQSTISDKLNKRKQYVETIIGDHDEDCVKQVYKVFCHYYLPPCGNITHPAPPSSICQEECQMVQDKCQRTWDALQLAFKDIEPVIDCSETSKFLFPVPQCCTGAGIGQGRSKWYG